MKTISGNIIDVTGRKIFPGTINIDGKKISDIKKESNTYKNYILPGFIDAHVHIESSMLVPSEFARAAVRHGTIATVSDPHEIANVLGMEGVRFMIDNARKVPFKIYFGAPSCVPATAFETSGAVISPQDIKELFEKDNLKYLSEMMNFPGVIFSDKEVMKKINIAKGFGKPIDGHSPGLTGDDLKKYAAAGISTDHECFTLEEANEKISLGMKILIREGSAAKNFDALKTLVRDKTSEVMLCSDDKHPDDLLEGHINLLVKRCLAEGYDLFDVLQCTIVNPINHYGLDVGMLKIGDAADFIVIDNPENFNVLETYIDGNKVYGDGKVFIESVAVNELNKFNLTKKTIEDFKVYANEGALNVIEAFDGELITKAIKVKPKVSQGYIESDIENDILKIAVISRYDDGKPAIGFIKNFGIKKGAIASSVAHDSHNIICIGTNDGDMSAAVNSLVDSKGGISVCEGEKCDVLKLSVGGIMSSEDVYQVSEKYKMLQKKAKEMGSKLKAPFMTLSFMALLVIPELKLSDKGLFDGVKFQLTSLQS
jgi:adenine deaminase